MTQPVVGDRWLVDGTNLVGARPDGWWRDRPAAFARLVDDLTTFAEATGHDVAVVFDGRTTRAARTPRVEVFAVPSADDRIVALVKADADPGALTVVTSDRDLAGRVTALGASVIGAGSFRRRLDKVAYR